MGLAGFAESTGIVGVGGTAHLLVGSLAYSGKWRAALSRSAGSASAMALLALSFTLSTAQPLNRRLVRLRLVQNVVMLSALLDRCAALAALTGPAFRHAK